MPRQKKISKADLGWMAAVIDLKGKIYQKANKSRATPQLVLHVQSKDKRVIDRLSQLTGTKPDMRPGREPADFLRHPCALHCPEAHQHVYQWQMPDSGLWTITGVAMGVLLWNLKPYMATSYGYIEAMNSVFANTPMRGQGSGAARSSIKRLMDLGWAVPPHILAEYDKYTKTKVAAA